MKSIIGMKKTRKLQPNIIVVESKDGLRQFRIDLLQTKPHKNPHSHVISYKIRKNKKIKWDDARIFPKDVAPE